MELDTFYIVTIPEHTAKDISFNMKKFGTRIGIEPEETQVCVSEKKYYFKKRKQAKKFCLDNDYPLEYITKELY